MPRYKRPRNPSNPEADRWLRAAHALSFHEFILNFVNAREITPQNWVKIALGGAAGAWAHGITARTFPTICGRRVHDFGSVSDHRKVDHARIAGLVREMQACARRVLQRHLDDVEEPWNDPRTGREDFVVGGRRPFEQIRARVFEAPIQTIHLDPETGRCLPVVRDVQDCLYFRFVLLLADLRKGEHLRFDGKERNGRPILIEYRFRRLARCEAPKCRRFFFPSRSDTVTCSKRCENQAVRLRRAARRTPHRARPTYSHNPTTTRRKSTRKQQ